MNVAVSADNNTAAAVVALRESALNGSFDVVKVMLENGVSCRLQTQDALCVFTQMLIKCENVNGDDDDVVHENEKTARIFLERCTDINDTYCCDLLQLAAEYGHVRIVDAMLDRGANIHVNMDHPLYLAVMYGHLGIVQLLLDRGANANSKALYAAAQSNRPNVMQLLLDSGANVHEHDNHAMRVAAANGHCEIVKLLMQNGAILPIGFCGRNNTWMNNICFMETLSQCNVSNMHIFFFACANNLFTIVAHLIDIHIHNCYNL